MKPNTMAELDYDDWLTDMYLLAKANGWTMHVYPGGVEMVGPEGDTVADYGYESGMREEEARY